MNEISQILISRKTESRDVKSETEWPRIGQALWPDLWRSIFVHSLIIPSNICGMTYTFWADLFLLLLWKDSLIDEWTEQSEISHDLIRRQFNFNILASMVSSIVNSTTTTVL